MFSGKKWANNQIQQTYINMLRSTDFQNNCFIVTFLYAMFTIWKRFFQTRLNNVPETSYDKSQDIWKSSLFSKKVILTIK